MDDLDPRARTPHASARLGHHAHTADDETAALVGSTAASTPPSTSTSASAPASTASATPTQDGDSVHALLHKARTAVVLTVSSILANSQFEYTVGLLLGSALATHLNNEREAGFFEYILFMIVCCILKYMALTIDDTIQRLQDRAQHTDDPIVRAQMARTLSINVSIQRNVGVMINTIVVMIIQSAQTFFMSVLHTKSGLRIAILSFIFILLIITFRLKFDPPVLAGAKAAPARLVGR